MALLGANGAGKTTTLKAITGILATQNGELKDGTIEFLGKPIHKLDPDRIVKLGITMVPEGRKVFQDLTVQENLLIGAHTRSDRKGLNRISKSLRLFSCLGRAKEPVGHLPFRRGTADAGHRPGLDVQTQLMMLDEPSLGLAPLLVREIFQIIQTINQEESTSILLIEQNARMALNHSQYGYIMENGKIVLDGPCQSPDGE